MSSLRAWPPIVPETVTRTFFTIGHSTRSIGEFTALLQASAIELLVDIRSIPRSRTNPQFNRDSLPDTLADRQVGYAHIAELGGRKSRIRSVDPALNALWRVAAFHNYADYALTPPFAEGFAHLRELGRERTCAIMCSEAVWWRCHRRIVTDYLLAAGETVKHILGPAHVDNATLTPGAVVRDDASVVYPAGAETAPL